VKDPRLIVQTSPFLRQGVTTPGLMGDVLLALAPVLGVAVWVFGLSAILVVLASVAGAAGAEALFTRPRGKSLGDWSGVLTGVLLGLTLPPGFPLWMAFVGGFLGMALGKLIWGGLGHNLFNPALVGRAFLQAAFPTAITTWAAPERLWMPRPSNLAWPFMSPTVDGLSAATALNLMKFEHQASPTEGLFWGDVAGSLGETSAVVILLGGLYMTVRRVFDWRIPASILLTVAAFSGILYAVNPERFPAPAFMLFSGGLLFGAVFMATDPVTSPLAPRGAWAFGIGIGVLVVLIRVWGGMPEGVMYAILLMNGATPLIERVTQQRAFGHKAAATAS
jgi:electron transport complex protein RnfD